MPTLNNRNFTGLPGLNLRESNGCLRFETPVSTPVTTSGERLIYVNSSNELIYDDGSSTTVIGAAGGGGTTPTWETVFAADKTFTITPDSTWTIAGNRATATDVITVTNAAGGSGDCIHITNSGTGADIAGTSDTWSLSKAGLLTCVGVTSTSDFTTTGAAVDWDLIDNNASALSFDASGATGLLAIVTTNASEGVTMSGTCAVSGALSALSASNTVSNLVVTNNTATTFGADADSSGVAVLRSTSLTTGSLLQLQLTEGTLAGGFYLTCRDVTGGTNVCTIGEDGAFVSTGAGGSDMLTVTAGDVVFSDGSVTITDADNAASLSVTNNTATTASVVAIAGSGTFTGSTTGAFMTVTPSGLTTGTGLYMPLAAMTTGTGISVVADAMTSGTALKLTATEATLTSGKYIECYDGAANDFSVAKYGATVIAGNASGTAALTLTAGDVVITDGFLVLSANAKGVTFTGTGANGGVLKNLKNSAASALSGTQLDVEIDIGGTPYYFTCYPTKA